jgi:hypothetical protein
VLLTPRQGECPGCDATLVAAIHGEMGDRFGECMNCGALVALRLASLSDTLVKPVHVFLENPVRSGKTWSGDTEDGNT